MLIQDFLQRSAKLFPTTLAIDDGLEQLTFQQLAQRVDRCCALLRSHKIAPGRRVAVFGHNCVDYAVMYFACARLGLVLVPLNAYLRAAEIEWILQDCDAAAIVAGADYVARLSRECGAALNHRFCFVMGKATSEWIALIEGAALPTNTDRVTEHFNNSAGFAPHSRTVVIQMYTSGTTGTPKGVMLSHQNIVAVVLSWLHEMPVNATKSRLMQATPLFHVGGMLICLCAMASGSTLYMLPRFDAQLALDTLLSKCITHTLLVPSMIQQILLVPGVEACQFKALEVMVYGASSMPSAVLKRAIEVFGCAFLQGYGLTETAGVALSLRPEDHREDSSPSWPQRLQSAGRELLCCDVRVIDHQGNSVSPGEIGEIVIRGDNVCEGYWNNAEATQNTIVDGWLKTGDLGRTDEQGYIYVVDRLKDMVIVSGSNVYPAEVENVMRGHSWVADVAVIGLPNVILGEEVVAIIVLTPEGGQELERQGQRLVSQQLKLYSQQNLAAFKCPVRIKFISALPRTPAGKVQKNVLREQFGQEVSV